MAISFTKLTAPLVVQSTTERIVQRQTIHEPVRQTPERKTTEKCKTVSVTVRLSPDLLKQIDAEAKQRKLNRSQTIVSMLKNAP